MRCDGLVVMADARVPTLATGTAGECRESDAEDSTRQRHGISIACKKRPEKRDERRVEAK